MKLTLGKMILLSLLCIAFTFLNAGDFDYTVRVDKTNPYVKEAVILTVDVNQTNHNIVLLFDFDLVKSKSYSFQRIDIKEIDVYHAVQIQYTYLIYPLQSGIVDIAFKLTQKATTDESVAYSFSGDRDNVKGLVTTDTNIDLAPLKLNVKALPPGTQVVGNFSLDYKIKSLTGKAFEPLPLQITLKGLGYPPQLKTLLPKNSHTEGNFTRFTETPLVTSVASRKGLHNTLVYPMALSHKKSFTLSPIVLKAFNPTEEESYLLTVPAQHFTISQVDKSELLDTLDTPAPFQVDWSWIETLIGYMLVFGAGYLSALSWKWKKKKSHQEHHPLREKIQGAKTPKALLQVLMSKDSKRFIHCIERLEASIYAGKPVKLSTIKKEALEKIL